jgi:hypothetical protein
MTAKVEDFIDFEEDQNEKRIRLLLQKRKEQIESNPEYQKHKQKMITQLAEERIQKKDSEEKKRQLEEKKKEEELLIKKEEFRTKLINKINSLTEHMEPHFPLFYNDFLDDLVDDVVNTNYEDPDDKLENNCQKVINYQTKLNELYNVNNEWGVIMMLHNENRKDASKNFKPFLWDPDFIHQTKLSESLLDDDTNFYDLIPRTFYYFSDNSNEHACLAIEEIPNLIKKMKYDENKKISFDDYSNNMMNHIISKFRNKNMFNNNEKNNEDNNEENNDDNNGGNEENNEDNNKDNDGNENKIIQESSNKIKKKLNSESGSGSTDSSSSESSSETND